MPTFDYICEVCGYQGRASRRDGPPRFCGRDCMSKGMAGESRKPRKYIITPEMHEMIERVYREGTGDGEVNALARELKLPRWKITRYAILRGWIAKTSKGPDWTERELGILERNAHLSPERIALLLKARGYRRSVTGVVLKRKRMRFLRNLHGQSKRQVAGCFGVDDHCISRWIRLGFLKARRRGTKRVEAQGGDHWFIKDKWIKKFIVNNVAEIDFRKVDKFWLVDLLAGGPTAEDAGGKQIDTKDSGPVGLEFCHEDDVRDIFEGVQGLAGEEWRAAAN